MEKSIEKGLNDKLYEKRKASALELEKLVKQCVLENNYERIEQIIGHLCKDYAYALHQPMARNAGLMGLAATAIALGPGKVGTYLPQILPPVLACFGDQNDQVRFYACESLYNIAKIAKGEILIYFNEIFDVLCKISADTENSVKGAAELLNRLIKDIVAEKASNYISVVNNDPNDLPPATRTDPVTGNVYQEHYEQDNDLAFSLPKFVPLLVERVYAINPDTRIFLVEWIKVLLDSPDLELISYLPSFLGGLFTFLGDAHKDVRVITKSLLDQLLQEVVRVATIHQRLREYNLAKERKESLDKKYDSNLAKKVDGALIAEKKKSLLNALGSLSVEDGQLTSSTENLENIQAANVGAKFEDEHDGEEYIPGQDIHINFPEIIDILLNNLASSEVDIQLIVLQWIDKLLTLSTTDFIPNVPRVLSVLLKLLGHQDEKIRDLAKDVNEKLVVLCNNESIISVEDESNSSIAYGAIVNSLSLQFFDSPLGSRIASLDWLMLVYQKAPEKIMEHSEGLFLIILKSLTNKDVTLLDKALSLLNNICSDSNDQYLKKFLKAFIDGLKRDPKLLKARANYVLKQISIKLATERVYKIISSILEEDFDIIFVRMMIQIMSTNLMTASELFNLRKKLRNNDDIMFFNMIFKSWCCNPVSAISLCLVAENYELAYLVLQSYANHELKINDLIQFDILIQLIESPVFSRLRLQLLEQDKYPYLYKCLYGILMILPQSEAFEILNKRLSSVNVWFTQSSVQAKNTFYKQSNRSGVSDASTNSDLSQQRSVSNSKLHFMDLLDHFNKTMEIDYYSHKEGSGIKETHLGFLDGFNNNNTPENSSFKSEVSVRDNISNKDAFSDSGSVRIRNNDNSGITRKISGKFKKFSGVGP
ncbi:Vacuole morphology and inheritance protein 14 [Nakaseomyces bracarensis]|uniref:Vacuole morphology and inheritance protein 14 n=1 Tax=Nakaseomyces bracarensis TaxID=273131 RepID=A0ABR4NX28_9SACH